MDIPKIGKGNLFTNEIFAEGKLEEWRDKTKVSQVYAIDQECVNQLLIWVLKFIAKYEKGILQCDAKTETEFLQFFRNYLIIKVDGFYWNLAYGDKVEAIVFPEGNESAISIEIKSPKDSFKKNLIAFQRKGKQQTIIEKSRTKVKQIVTFFSMMFILLIMVNCRKVEYTDEPNEILSLSQRVCKERSYLIFFFGMAIFASLGSRFLTNIMKAKEKKAKMV